MDVFWMEKYLCHCCAKDEFSRRIALTMGNGKISTSNTHEYHHLCSGLAPASTSTFAISKCPHLQNRKKQTDSIIWVAYKVSQSLADI